MPTKSGTNGNDVLKGTDNGELVLGLGGNDVILGKGGNDTLDGGTGRDVLIGGTGNDTYVVDHFIAPLFGDLVVEKANEGIDTVQSSTSNWLPFNVENLILTGSADSDGTGNGLNNVLIGNAGDNTLNGHGGNDVLRGQAGNDILIGGDGNDYLDGGAGADRLEGGLGNDTYVVNDPGDVVVLEGADAGFDTVRTSVTVTLAGNIEKAEIVGSAAANVVGNGSDNIVTGNEAANAIAGAKGDDTLYGNGGNDTLTGGPGSDRLFGGAGDDVFRFVSLEDSAGGGQPDLIADFAAGDRISLAAIDANSAAAGDQAFAFIGEQAFTGTAGELNTLASGSQTFVNGDVDGDGAADFTVAIAGLHVLSAGDFLL